MLTRSKLARETGCNIETIRYFERTGLLPEPPRSASGYRVYGAEHLRLLRFIQRARELGFTADRIRDLLKLDAESGQHTRAEVKNLTHQHIDEISERIRDLQELRDRLTAIADHCDGSNRSASSCPILLSLFDPSPDDSVTEK